ncbi:hypothetical protein Slala02_33260 [Streptomyces lavendulae subsp. lavendulae]|nr:hypothetical protein Slala01_37030 [Streptomyces lavendulae subsp. lavendulae]GLX27506.1 hypothetical protein Slala02_33260 [Streptomyces lavendulae subsp. lavendulae]
MFRCRVTGTHARYEWRQGWGMKDERWMTLFLGLNVAAWAAEFWILWDPDLQGVQDAIGWWMVAVFFGFPLLTGIPFAILHEEPAAPGDGSDSGPHWTHEESCGSQRYGCGG